MSLRQDNSDTKFLLADAEVLEDVGEDVLGGDLTSGDFGKMVETLTKILGYEIS